MISFVETRTYYICFTWLGTSNKKCENVKCYPDKNNKLKEYVKESCL